MIVNGRNITKELLTTVRESHALADGQLVVRAIVLEPSPATESYLRIKERRASEAGMYLELIRLESEATTEDLIQKIQLPGADAIIVQLPLPETIDTKRVLDAIPLSKDADVLSTEAHALFAAGAEEALLPPVVGAVREILERSNIDPKGMQVVVVGKGWLVGEPVATWLTKKGASVTSLDKSEGLDALKDADLVVSGAGSPELIQPHHLKAGVVLIDAGTSESGGSIVGDASPACAELASIFTPVPGGVGPIAVACLFKNVSILATRASLQTREKAV